MGRDQPGDVSPRTRGAPFSATVNTDALSVSPYSSPTSSPLKTARSRSSRCGAALYARAVRKLPQMTLGFLLLAAAAFPVFFLSLEVAPSTSELRRHRHGAVIRGNVTDTPESPITAALSVMVQHETAAERLPAEQLGGALLQRDQLPSWTLRVVAPTCAQCFDSVTHGDAFVGGGGAAGDTNDDEDVDSEAAQQAERVPVFATSAAPLGLVGPMLFAMASVTDDVDVAAELARWPWVTRSYAQLREGARGGQRPRHLVVLGIPSTDQPRRYPLRDGQRATWLTFREVARRENDFTGALLPLYIFAAAEPEVDATAHSFPDLDGLLPTADEYVAASAQRVAAGRYAQRRVMLRDGWRDVAASEAGVWQSPCAGVRAVAASPALDVLAGALSLPATPAYVAPATYVCHASTALWQEALRHRNALWLDFMTDLKPTTNKKMGMSNSWGMPVEVGMSQKVVLWLNYAYTAFPDVPYIMKGDDDVHLKVPQYLSDLRHAQGGWSEPRNLIATLPHGDVVPETLTVEETPECLYRVWALKYGRIFYSNGVGYALDRRLVQASLNVFDKSNRVLLKLVTTPFNPAWASTYEQLIMQYEDVLVARQVKEHVAEIRAVCPRRRVCYLSDRVSRDHALFRWPNVALSWDSTLVHYGRAAMPYYVHHFHTHEHQVAATSAYRVQPSKTLARIDRKARKAMQRFVQRSIAVTLPGYDTPPEAMFVRGPQRPEFVMAEGDNVAVYAVEYANVSNPLVECLLETGFDATAHGM